MKTVSPDSDPPPPPSWTVGVALLRFRAYTGFGREHFVLLLCQPCAASAWSRPGLSKLQPSPRARFRNLFSTARAIVLQRRRSEGSATTRLGSEGVKCSGQSSSDWVQYVLQRFSRRGVTGPPFSRLEERGVASAFCNRPIKVSFQSEACKYFLWARGSGAVKTSRYVNPHNTSAREQPTRAAGCSPPPSSQHFLKHVHGV